MSVLIKGMEMPASCLLCPHHEHGTIHEWELYCGLTGDYIGHWDDKSLNNGRRPDFCPLVEIPTPHGRLIDGEKAKEELRRAEALTRAFGYHNVIETISEVPTIIEAEEGDPDVNTD